MVWSALQNRVPRSRTGVKQKLWPYIRDATGCLLSSGHRGVTPLPHRVILKIKKITKEKGMVQCVTYSGVLGGFITLVITSGTVMIREDSCPEEINQKTPFQLLATWLYRKTHCWVYFPVYLVRISASLIFQEEIQPRSYKSWHFWGLKKCLSEIFLAALFINVKTEK